MNRAGWILRVLLPVAMAGMSAGARAGDEPGDAIVIKLVRPEGQAAAILDLFDGARASSPAAALSRWKRASIEPGRLGKPLEAVIAVFNPAMAPEWKTLDGTTVAAGLDASKGSLRWRMHLPHDDGSIASLLTAMRLSGGGDEAPLGASRVATERLGATGAVASRSADGLDIAGSRADLERELRDRGSGESLPFPGAGRDVASGLLFRIEPSRLPEPQQSSDATRRAIALANGLGCRALDGSLAVRGDAIGLEVAGRLDEHSPFGRVRGGRPIDPAWLAFAPADAPAVLCLAAGDGPAYWDSIFRLADRVDRAPPARAGMAPLRTRLTLLAATAGARLEADLWPHLKGLTLVVLADPSMAPRLGLALHMDGEPSARALVLQTLPRLAVLWGGRDRKEPAPNPAATTRLGQVRGRPIEVSARGSTVVVGWGAEVVSALLASAERPASGLVARLERESARDARRGLPNRVGLFQPGRVRLPVAGLDGHSPLSDTLAEGSPLVWAGWSSGDDSFDRLEWADLKPLVRRFLEKIPLAPAAR
ncbi:hypothetical protein [Aquisphaera insulae]|uniref:hypothetical protein n=1 Tax=Aquisphaera insulae TaxID=2712864 RepID=UPI0013EBA5CA|nr:hypothetical protein [Aquisphaera insulae]